MPINKINNVNLYWELSGQDGDPLILIHGSWVNHHNWDGVVNELSRTFRVLTYDRRGHSQSERLPEQGSTQQDVGDLIALAEYLDLQPAHIVGNSFGASIALKTAAKKPDLFKTVIAHEPPLLELLKDSNEFKPLLQEIKNRINVVAELIAKKENEEAARKFVETIAFSPGAWEQLPEEIQSTFVFNAPTWYDEIQDPESLQLDMDSFANFNKPALLTNGTESPPFFLAVLDQLSEVIPHAKRKIFEGAGHVPYLSHPVRYIQTVKDFCLENT